MQIKIGVPGYGYFHGGAYPIGTHIQSVSEILACESLGRAMGEHGPARRCVVYCWSWPGLSTQVDFKTIHFTVLLIKLPSKAIWVTFLTSILSFSLCKCNYHGDDFKQSDLEFSR